MPLWIIPLWSVSIKNWKIQHLRYSCFIACCKKLKSTYLKIERREQFINSVGIIGYWMSKIKHWEPTHLFKISTIVLFKELKNMDSFFFFFEKEKSVNQNCANKGNEKTTFQNHWFFWSNRRVKRHTSSWKKQFQFSYIYMFVTVHMTLQFTDIKKTMSFFRRYDNITEAGCKSEPYT